MPSRPIAFSIIAFWIITIAWFVHREIWPRIASTGPAPFTIEITDEAVRHFAPLRWGLYRNNQRITTVRTAVDFCESDDSFALNATVGTMDIVGLPGLRLKLTSLTNQYRVRRDGQLIAAKTHVGFDLAGTNVLVTITAEVRDSQVVPQCRIEYPGGVLEPPLEPFPTTRTGMLNPLHPVHRIAGLRVGQRWLMPLDDPLTDAIRATVDGFLRQQWGPAAPKLPRAGPQTLSAVVVGPKLLAFNGHDETCLVIEYRGDDYSAETWVRQADGAVLKQSASGAGESLSLVRE